MPLYIERGDLATFAADALVNAANSHLQGGGGVSGALFSAAGWGEMQAACDAIGHCETGQAVITPAFALPARFVIHAVGPIWRGGQYKEKELLASAYQSALDLARTHQLSSIAFPLLSSGIYGYPQAEAVDTAIKSIRAWLDRHEDDLTVTLVLYHREDLQIDERLRRRVDEALSRAHSPAEDIRYSLPKVSKYTGPDEQALFREIEAHESDLYVDFNVSFPVPTSADLSELIRQRDEGFSATLLRLIDAKGMQDTEVYKRANIDRKHFSKIRSKPDYSPSKYTVLALAIALRLSRNEAEQLLARAGYALSPAYTTDIIIGFFIDQGRYDIDEINTMLFTYEQGLLGG